MIKKILTVIIVLLVIGCAFGDIQNPTGELGRDGHFIAYNNGTVLDTKTNLMWAAKDNGKVISWLEAKSYCENYRSGGYTDWRMPTQDELLGLYDASKGYWPDCLPLFGTHVHLTDLIHLTCYSVFASETRNSEYAYVSFATNNATHQGYKGWLSPKRAIDRVLPVRSVK